MNNNFLTFASELLSVHLIPKETLKPHEKHCLQNLTFLMNKITKENVWTKPLLIDWKTKIIMDGHHRHEIAKKLGLKYIPCIMLSYDNPYLRVYSYNNNCEMNTTTIIEAGLSGKLLQKKSTRHELLMEGVSINIPLELLK